jgi:hypothetical protein
MPCRLMGNSIPVDIVVGIVVVIMAAFSLIGGDAAGAGSYVLQMRDAGLIGPTAGRAP